MWYDDFPEGRLVPTDYGEGSWPRCPVCGTETDRLYRSEQGDIVGCEECVSHVDAWQWWEDYERGY